VAAEAAEAVGVVAVVKEEGGVNTTMHDRERMRRTRWVGSVTMHRGGGGRWRCWGGQCNAVDTPQARDIKLSLRIKRRKL